MPKNWKTYKLGDIDEIQILDGDRGKNYPKKNEFSHEGFCLFLSAKNVTKSGFEFNELSFITKEKDQLLRKGKLNRKDIVLTTRGTVGNIGYFKDSISFENIRINSGMVIIRANEKYVDSSYLYQYLRSSIFQQQVDSRVSGSAQPQLPIRDLNFIEFNLPPLPEQKAIANILSAIDDKIENNLAINNTLEDMAMALYKHWFVDFGPFQEGEFIDSELGPIPKGWEVKRLDEVAYKNSKTFDFKGKEKVVFVNTGDVQNGSFLHDNYSDVEGLPGQAKKVIEPNDILYSEIRPKNRRFAYVDFDSSEYVVSTKFMIIRNNEKINNRLLYRVLTRQDTIDEFQMIAESRSGTFPQITFDVIGHFPIALPNIDLQNKFQDLVEPFEQTQANNLKVNQTLIKLRDTLLPKLISGEIRLKEFQDIVANAVKQTHEV